MNRGDWKDVRRRIRKRWGKLSRADLAFIGGRRDHLIHKIQERYGGERGAIEREVDGWYLLDTVCNQRFALVTSKPFRARRGGWFRSSLIGNLFSILGLTVHLKG